MLGAQSCARTVYGVATVTDQSNVCHLISNAASSYLHLSFQLKLNHRSKSVLICCKNSSSSGSSGRKSNNSEHDSNGDDYIEASILMSETKRHHRMRIHGFPEEIKWQSSEKLLPFPIQRRDRRVKPNLIGPELLRQFQSPTIFLKISCDGDFLLPIIVGESAVEKLIESLQEDECRSSVLQDCPNHFQLVGHIVGKLGYEVKMIRITERVVSTYHARICFRKPGRRDILQVDARPSDAINVAQRCRAPIYVNKQVVLADAIRIGYRIGRTSNAVYDVTLDSAADGPDLLLEELVMVKNMNLAIKQERYTEAAMWRDKLMKHRDSRHEL